MKNIFIQLCFLLLLSISVLYSQEYLDRQGIVRTQIMNLIHMRYGTDFQNVGYSILDSLIYYSRIGKNNKIQDPYNTLKGCILFSTYKDYGESLPDTFIVGIVKNGQIIWDNAPGSNADLGGDLLYARDINNDGKVDLLISENDRELSLMRGPFLYYLYILSWDGTKGTFINEFRVNGKSSLAGNGGYELIKRDKKGIWKIKTSLPDVGDDWDDHKTKIFPGIIYSWNGSQYGFWRKEKKNR